MSQVIEIHAGNSADEQVPILNADGTARDLTGVTSLTFLVKRRVDDADVAAVITATPVVSGSPALGIVAVGLSPAVSVSVTPGWYVWALQFKESSGKVWEFPDPTQEPGKFHVRQSVVVTVPA